MGKNAGIILYDIERDGCLNGTYTNISADGFIYNEIIRKKDDSFIDSKDSIVGDYNCLWFEEENERCECDLEIRIPDSAMPKIYSFKWRNGAKFDGVGYKMNDRQISVSYS